MASGDKRTETLVGLFLFIGLALLGGLIVQYGRFSGRMKSGYTVTVEFKDASGVIKGSQVRLGGAMIGQVVEKPESGSNRKVKVLLAIREDVLLPTNAVFQITSLSLLGDKAIVVSIPTALPGKPAGRGVSSGRRAERTGGDPGGCGVDRGRCTRADGQRPDQLAQARRGAG